ncbi:MAG: hypothetical protein IJD92_02290 [Bacilli bacterium]|nr:hypothetical protein [Bacilli bacterium]
MNKYFTKKILYKNHFYLFYKHVFDATNKNNYNEYKETYLIDIDNFDIIDKLRLNNIEKKFIYKSELELVGKKVALYNNIKTYRINLDYLRKKKYNQDKLTNIERNCLIFIEQNKEVLTKYINNKYLRRVIELFDMLIQNGEIIPVYDKEELEESIREEMFEQGIEQGLEKEKVSIAKILKIKKHPVKEISEITGLSIEEINKL